MNTKLVSLAGLLAITTSGCAALGQVRHEYIMRGQVLSVEHDGVYLCVGKRDGAEPGQELTVDRYVPRPSANPKVGPSFDRKAVGRVRITSVVDEHYALASRISGEVATNDVVELDSTKR